MSSSLGAFKKLKDTRSPGILEVDGQIFTQDDQLPKNFEQKRHAPLIDLKTFSPLYSTRVRHRASTLLSRRSPEQKTSPWRLIYYADYPRLFTIDAYHRLQALHNTPGDLLINYVARQGTKLASMVLSNETKSKLRKFLGITNTIEGPKKNRSGNEKIEHIAFHPSIMLLAVSTTFARVHLFDLRTNTFLDYYLCSADDPEYVVITSLAFNKRNQLAVGMDNGCVDVWTLNLAAKEPGPWKPTDTSMKALGPLFTPIHSRIQQVSGEGSEFGWSPPTKKRLPTFFMSTPSPGTQKLLARDSGEWRGEATLEKVQLIVGEVARQDKLIGEVTVVAYSPSGKHLAVGTSMGGVWVYNLVQETSVRVHSGLGIGAGARCTALSWGVPPDVRSVPLRGEGVNSRYQLETGDTALMVGMKNGLVVYIPLRENGSSSITFESIPIEFWPNKITPEVPLGKGIGQVFLVPSPPNTKNQLYGSFPTLVISIIDSPGIYIFRLIPESILKASVPSASSVLPTPTQRGVVQYEKLRYHCWKIYQITLQISGKFFGGYLGTQDRIQTVYVGSVDTSYTCFLETSSPLKGDIGNKAPGGYGGVVKSMAVDPTARRLVASFSHTARGGKTHESVVWFNVSGITASASTLVPISVVRRVTCRDESEGIGEVGFAGGCEKGVCAGIIVGGGKGIGIFPGFIGQVVGA